MMNRSFSRRDFLKLVGYTSTAAALWGCAPRSASPTFSPVQAPSNSEDEFIAAALRRITLGPLPEEIAHAKRIGFKAFVEEQLAPQTLDDSALVQRLEHLTVLDMPASELVALEKRSRPVTELVQATLLRAVYSRRQLYELMVNFWSDHFNIYVLKTKDRFLKVVDDREVIRPNALGSFRELLSASMHSPAMLIYLDNASSTKDGPTENYSRELMELHTLGVNGGYSQTDVVEVARALTGWSVTLPRNGGEIGKFIFHEHTHDNQAKQILGVDFPAGQGIQDGEQLVDLLASHPSTADHISYKLARRFVSDSPPPALVSRASSAFQTSRGDITAVLRVILFSDEFRASLGLKLKRPFEYFVSALRQTNADAALSGASSKMLRQMGQTPFFWPSPNGYPDTATEWLNSNDLMARWNFALGLAVNAFPDTQIDWEGLAGSTSHAEILDTLSLRLLGNILEEDIRQYMLEQASMITGMDPAFSIGALLLASPYFQYR